MTQNVCAANNKLAAGYLARNVADTLSASRTWNAHARPSCAQRAASMVGEMNGMLAWDTSTACAAPGGASPFFAFATRAASSAVPVPSASSNSRMMAVVTAGLAQTVNTAAVRRTLWATHQAASVGKHSDTCEYTSSVMPCARGGKVLVPDVGAQQFARAQDANGDVH